ncbi:MAG: RtcB family protein [Candidatus Contendobacter sp.]
MDLHRFTRKSAIEWHIDPHGAMRVPGVLFATENLIGAMDDQVYQQVVQVATLPGIVQAVYAMPDARPGHGFPKGGVAAFDPEQGGVVVGGGIGVDIAWGAHVLRTGLNVAQILPFREALADSLHTKIPNGNSIRVLRLTPRGLDAMLLGGARWAVEMGYGSPADLERIEEQGCVAGADPGQVSELAKTRQRDEMGTLGPRDHYLKVQRVAQVHDLRIAKALGIQLDDILVSIHCGSRSLGGQIGVDYHKRLAVAAGRHGIALPDRDLACATLDSEIGQCYLGAMRAGVNCAHANRQILTHLTRRAFTRLFPEARVEVLFGLSYNTCRPETHVVEGRACTLYVHRKGASRMLGLGHPDLPAAWREMGQPGLIGGAMGTQYILIGAAASLERAFGSSCHGMGSAPQRYGVTHPWRGLVSQDVLMRLGILIRGPDAQRGVLVEEAPGAGGDNSVVMDTVEQAGLARRVVRLELLICIQG